MPKTKIDDGLTPQQRYYRKVKDDPEFKKKNQAWRKAYYDRNAEQERENALNRYYHKKYINSQTPEGSSTS